MIAFRVDGSLDIGSGHISRCSSFAYYLQNAGKECIFFINDGDVDFENTFLKNFKTIRIPKSLEWNSSYLQKKLSSFKNITTLVFDSYRIDHNFEKHFTELYTVFVIDDLANRKHDCHFLLDQNFYFNANTRYAKLVPADCKLLLGPNYSILRPEFYSERSKSRVRTGKNKKILVSMGGTDPTGETLKVIKSIKNLKEFEFHILVSKLNKDFDQIVKKTLPPFIKLHIQSNQVAQLMNQCDLSIGTGGSTSWERCFLGLPNLTICVADNQLELSLDLACFGASEFLGWNTDLPQSAISDCILRFFSNPSLIHTMSSKCFEMTPNTLSSPLVLTAFK